MKKLVSVIVPVYNTEKYIEKCITSILGQTYKNLELILVNDGSKQNEEGIIGKYLDSDSRVKYIKRIENRGLFCTRIDGVKRANGEYILFVDSDDYINSDYVRLLVEKAQKEDADIVFSTTVMNTPRQKKNINILQDVELNQLPLEGVEIRKAYFQQAGAAYVWHTIWNKIYKKSLWDKCLPYFEKLDKHIVMTEDIAFSTVLFYYAKKVSRAKNSVYYYCQHEEASTSTKYLTFDIYKKKVSDIIQVFRFLEEFYQDKEEWIQEKLYQFKQYYARIWNRGIVNISDGNTDNAKVLIAELCSEFGNVNTSEDGYFNLSQVPYTTTLDEIKEHIWESDAKYVSFDVFDTVITRPFYKPTDLFYLLDKKFEGLTCNCLGFHTIRTEGEQALREYKCVAECKEDVTIDEIYDYIGKMYFLSDEICYEMKKNECELEIQFCKNRETIHELYDIALLSGKKVIFVSDMYLDDNTIKSMLHKNGYTEYEKVFVSSAYGKLKATGNLFKVVLDEIKIVPNEMIHLGDNVNSDVNKAKELGIDSIHIPKALDVFMNDISGIETNRCGSIGRETTGIYTGEKSFEKLNGYGSMIALIANKYFDNPFRAFHPMTDFNIDPYFMGYYVLGMNLIAQVEWLKRYVECNNILRVIFMARDGYMLDMAYQIYKSITQSGIQSEYRYASRKAMLPIMLQNKIEFMNLPIVYQRYNPRMILELLNFCAVKENNEDLVEIFRENGFEMNRAFSNIAEYHRFMHIFFEYAYDERKHQKSIEIIKEYWADIKDTDCIYDMGYSAAIHNGVVRACGKNVTALFVHTDKSKHGVMKRRVEFGIQSMIDSIPNVSGLLREHFFSNLEPSCIGYEETLGRCVPILEKEEAKNYQDVFPLNMMQKAALEMVSDFYGTFKEYLPYLDIRVDEIMLPFEGFLCSPAKIDTKVFTASNFEDKVYGANARINIRDFWLQTLTGLSGYQGEDIVNHMEQYVEEKGKKQLAFFGTGRMCVDILEKYHVPVTVFLDNNEEKNGKDWYGGKIAKPSEVENLDDLFIVIVCAAYMEIEEQLENMGLVRFKDYISYMELF